MATRVVVRPVAAPLPLGFFALAAGTFILAGVQLHWVALTQQKMAALCLLAVVVPLQVISSVFGFLARDVVAASGMGMLAGSWLAIGLVMHAGRPGAVSGALGLLLVASAGALLTIAVAAIATKPLAGLVIGTTSVRFATAGAYQLGAGDTWRSVTAVVGLVLCAFAWYGAVAFLLESELEHAVLPTFRRKSLPDDPERALVHDVEAAGYEAGVRSPA